MVTAPARREVVREIVTRGLSERRALTVVHMSAAALRYLKGRLEKNPVWIIGIRQARPQAAYLSERRAHGRQQCA